MTTGEQGRTPPDAEHYLDLSGIEEDSPGPHFDVVLRGYDRRQVDEHVAGLRRMNAQLRAQLAVRERRRSASGPDAAALEGRLSDTIPEARRTPPAEEEEAAGNPDMVGAFNDRLRGILQAAEQEAQLVRSKAAESLLAEHAESRAALAELRAQRDAVVDELVRLRGRLDDIVSGPVRPSAGPPAPPAPPRPAAPGAPGPQPGPWRGPGRPPAPPGPGPRPPYGAGRPVPPGAPAPMAVPAGDGRAHGQDPTLAAPRDQIDAAGVEDTLTVHATPAPEDATETAAGAGTDAGTDADADTGSADAVEVEVTEGAHPSTAATRPAPSTPERAADG
ncbi:DivIVA domain-containing protein [Actinomycetospora sp. C-140]